MARMAKRTPEYSYYCPDASQPGWLAQANPTWNDDFGLPGHVAPADCGTLSTVHQT